MANNNNVYPKWRYLGVRQPPIICTQYLDETQKLDDSSNVRCVSWTRLINPSRVKRGQHY